MRVIAMDHIVVKVSNVDEALRFYGDISGLEVAPDGDRVELKTYTS